MRKRLAKALRRAADHLDGGERPHPDVECRAVQPDELEGLMSLRRPLIWHEDVTRFTSGWPPDQVAIARYQRERARWGGLYL